MQLHTILTCSIALFVAALATPVAETTVDNRLEYKDRCASDGSLGWCMPGYYCKEQAWYLKSRLVPDFRTLSPLHMACHDPWIDYISNSVTCKLPPVKHLRPEATASCLHSQCQEAESMGSSIDTVGADQDPRVQEEPRTRHVEDDVKALRERIHRLEQLHETLKETFKKWVDELQQERSLEHQYNQKMWAHVRALTDYITEHSDGASRAVTAEP
ncbi:hypothetical protein CBS147347_11194 [Aspergillus niger]|nr:hypothetical protein CBS147347_11194 [Aspergillus niger]